MKILETLSANNPVAKMYNTNTVRHASICLDLEDYDEISEEELDLLENPFDYTNENFMRWLASI
jgi:hypothetical protein